MYHLSFPGESGDLPLLALASCGITWISVDPDRLVVGGHYQLERVEDVWVCWVRGGDVHGSVFLGAYGSAFQPLARHVGEAPPRDEVGQRGDQRGDVVDRRGCVQGEGLDWLVPSNGGLPQPYCR